MFFRLVLYCIEEELLETKPERKFTCMHAAMKAILSNECAHTSNGGSIAQRERVRGC